MLYFLKNISTGAEIILEEKDHLIGRKDCDIILKNDQSISRKHAYIRIKSDCCTLEDIGSKYHTFHNSVELKPKMRVNLNHKDVIKFGILNHSFSFEAYKFVVTASGLSSNKKNVLKSNVEYCGGRFIDKWSPCCTHLVVEEITLTIKVLQALINELIIVTPDYWVAYKQSMDNNTSTPNTNKYNNPKISEQLQRSDFQCIKNPIRKTLFQNKIFVFYKNNFKEQMQNVIESCGGECFAWEEEEKTFDEMRASHKEYLMIKTDESSNSFNNIIKKFQKENKRAIPLNEIALAIISCSCQRHCNPNFDKVKEIFAKETEKFQGRDILVEETQTQPSTIASVHIKSENIIPATLELEFTDVCKTKELNRPSGVKRLNNDGQESITKKQKFQTINEETKNTQDNFTIEKGGGGDLIEVNIKKEKEEEQPQHSSKRKAEEVSVQKINPFNIVRQLTSKKRTLSVDGLVDEQSKKVKIINQSVCPIQIKTQEKKKNGIPETFPECSTKENPLFTSSLNKSITGTWISKNTKIKSEISKIEDTELKEISDAFKNCVHIKQLPLSFIKNIKPLPRVDYSGSSSCNGIRNYKKFRKVVPLKPQVNFISRDTLMKICANSVADGNATIKSDSEDDCKEQPKQKLRTFIL